MTLDVVIMQFLYTIWSPNENCDFNAWRISSTLPIKPLDCGQQDDADTKHAQ